MNVAPPGIYAACITPFDSHGAIDEGALRAHLDYLGAAGVGVFLPLVGTGESQLMREEEIRRVWEIGLDQLQGKVPVYACGIGPTDTAYTTKRANEAGALGFDGVYVYAPRPLPSPIPQGRIEQERYFDELLSAVEYPLHIANNPFIIGYSVPEDLFERMVTEHGNVIGICNADNSVSYTERLLAAVGEKTTVLEVITTNLLTSLALGGGGALCIEANVAPRLARSVFESVQSGDMRGASESYHRLLKLNMVTGKFQNPTGIKAALNIMGLSGGVSRRPYLPPDEAGHDEIRRVIEELDLKRIEGLA